MSSPESVLESFINEMKVYEIKWGELMQKDLDAIFSDLNCEKRLAEIIYIQNKYLSKKALSLDQARRVNLSFRTPPEYDQRITDENILNSRTVEIFTAVNDDSECRKFTLTLENEGWKIDKMSTNISNWKNSRQLF
ncbi:NTF2 fold immunity protein [Acinetobacter gerneri]|uniref:NTF2 fold immunity protein n=1 Tax=Acinetobacter gerneri TaxID=202952 RepID=UPI003A884A6E